MDKDDVFKKWAPILDNIGITGSKADCVPEYMNNISDDNKLGLTSSNESFPNILPIAIRVASQTISQNLISVQPIGGNSIDELERISKEVLSENRDRKINAIIKGEEYKEMKVEEHQDYRRGPSGKLFYMDFKYDNSTTTVFNDKPKTKKFKNNRRFN